MSADGTSNLRITVFVIYFSITSLCDTRSVLFDSSHSCKFSWGTPTVLRKLLVGMGSKTSPWMLTSRSSSTRINPRINSLLLLPCLKNAYWYSWLLFATSFDSKMFPGRSFSVKQVHRRKQRRCLGPPLAYIKGRRPGILNCISQRERQKSKRYSNSNNDTLRLSPSACAANFCKYADEILTVSFCALCRNRRYQ
jgi:hypothetical protein